MVLSSLEFMVEAEKAECGRANRWREGGRNNDRSGGIVKEMEIGGKRSIDRNWGGIGGGEGKVKVIKEMGVELMIEGGGRMLEVEEIVEEERVTG